MPPNWWISSHKNYSFVIFLEHHFFISNYKNVKENTKSYKMGFIEEHSKGVIS